MQVGWEESVNAAVYRDELSGVFRVLRALEGLGGDLCWEEPQRVRAVGATSQPTAEKAAGEELRVARPLKRGLFL